jgi:hypothetical protein
MARVLIPFSDLASGERALARLIARPRDPRLIVELLAIVDPLTPGRIPMIVSPEPAHALACRAARRWLDCLEALSDAARIRYRSQIAVGRRGDILRHEGKRPDIDEVLIGARERDPLQRWRRRFVAHAMHRPVVSIG